MSMEIMNQLSPGSNVYADKDGYVTYNPGLDSDPNKSIGIISAFDASQGINMMKMTSLDGNSIDIPGMLSGVSINQTIELYPSDLNTEPSKLKTKSISDEDFIKMAIKPYYSYPSTDFSDNSPSVSASSVSSVSASSVSGKDETNKKETVKEPVKEDVPEVSEFHFLEIKD